MSDMGDDMFLLKVPRWLSELWEKHPPGHVADLDLDTGKLELLGAGKGGRPCVFDVHRRPSPELFAYTEQEGGKLRVEGGLKETLQVRPCLGDAAYKHILQQRTEDSATTAGHRSVHDPVVVPYEHKNASIIQPLVKVTEAEELECITEGASKSAETAMFAAKQALKAAVHRCLGAKRDTGVTCAQLADELPRGCILTTVGSALAELAECRRMSDGSKRYFLNPRVSALPLVFSEAVASGSSASHNPAAKLAREAAATISTAGGATEMVAQQSLKVSSASRGVITGRRCTASGNRSADGDATGPCQPGPLLKRPKRM